jgi:hypothetical protein
VLGLDTNISLTLKELYGKSSKYIPYISQVSFAIPSPEDEHLRAHLKGLLSTKLENNLIHTEDSSKESKVENNEHKIYEITDRIDKYSDYDPDIRQALVYAASMYGRDIRKLKSFLNIFRFYVFISYVYSHSTPSLAQLRDWIILLNEWPTVIGWLEYRPRCFGSGMEYESDSIRTSRRLHLLENVAHDGWNKDDVYKNKDWQDEIEDYPGLKVLIENWMKDRCLKNFFHHQSQLPLDDRLSSAARLGII